MAKKKSKTEFFQGSYGFFLEKLRYYDIENLAVHGICNFGQNLLAVLRY